MDWALARDIAIVVLAVFGIIAAFAVLVAAIMMIWVLRLVYSEGQPILKSARGTVNAVQGTTRFVSELAVRPIVSVVGAVKAIGKITQVLRRHSNSKGGGE